MTGVPRKVCQTVAWRAAYSCEICGRGLTDGSQWTTPHSFHHRRPRGMGGSTAADTNTPANVLLLCGTGTTGCHGDVESQRQLAYAHGWLVPQGTDPATVPVDVASFTRPVWLDHTDTYRKENPSCEADPIASRVRP
jgi:hypothetical protein